MENVVISIDIKKLHFVDAKAYAYVGRVSCQVQKQNF